ncbi:MAG: PTS fructose-like transporter subunit IIB [Clostridium sp.]|jgi:fructose-specific PTS system IIB-like component|uniref:PTS fructose-like transporter subunit IIB n=1 Tax=Clostridium sp. TaxID=1506 RepID=UPI0025C5690D|nr:PTS fructose-like transporter subunit IIB [Clostridium sp.]MCH3964955.1 PTS fructose-like transporter subunit IIB [Clostridium sp.]MCI1716551.1 PTS fructose-like transporter subunit IIB [Clostridium sp.]MCI1800967.1 PTS fructose-like transporter subunit IIB [Clostridium sp.]MCI1814728.1 PTS fructose-like transporter subunit IIB [Clostridium sp.]MCI1871714.1 PTS fructose-like transporter subunit IIB [Clostridium sp.]
MNVVAVTSCPSGVAHTYMAAEAIEKAFKAAGHNVRVETQGSIGVENKLTEDEIKNADYVILTKDVAIKDEGRFKGKSIVRVTAGNAIKKSDAMVKKLEEHLVNSKK